MEVEFTEYSNNQFAVLRGNSHAELWENSHAELWENSHAVLRENSHAELWGNSHAELWGNSHAQCQSPYACGILKSVTAECSGRHVGDKAIPPKTYLGFCGIEIKRGLAILYKSVTKDYTDHKTGKIQYTIGQKVVCPDWDAASTDECGRGLHLSPTVKQAISFNDSSVYLACQVEISDIACLPAFAQYPDKIRVRACTPLYQVDIEGIEIKEVNPVEKDTETD
jgi:hypothetical protein